MNQTHGKAAMRSAPAIKGTTLGDLYDGRVLFYDTRVKLVKASSTKA